MSEKLLRIEEVAVRLGCSSKSINNWYWFRREYPDNEYAKMLPDYFQEGPRKTRFWREEDIPKLKMFKDSIPQGRGGIMGCVTQKYYHKDIKYCDNIMDQIGRKPILITEDEKEGGFGKFEKFPIK